MGDSTTDDPGYPSSDNERLFDTGQSLRTHWTAEEDNRLRELVEHYGPMKWAHIAKELASVPPRNGKSCRLRWYNQLCPQIKKGPFSAEERATVIKRQAQIGNRWAEIAQDLPGRTDNAVKNFWNGHLRRLQERQKAASGKRDATSAGVSGGGLAPSKRHASGDESGSPSADSCTSQRARRLLPHEPVDRSLRGEMKLQSPNYAAPVADGHQHRQEQADPDYPEHLAKVIVDTTLSRMHQDRELQQALDALAPSQREQVSAAVRRHHRAVSLASVCDGVRGPSASGLMGTFHGGLKLPSYPGKGAGNLNGAAGLCAGRLSGGTDGLLNDGLLAELGSTINAYDTDAALTQLAATCDGGLTNLPLFGGAGGGQSGTLTPSQQAMLFNLAMGQSHGFGGSTTGGNLPSNSSHFGAGAGGFGNIGERCSMGGAVGAGLSTDSIDCELRAPMVFEGLSGAGAYQQRSFCDPGSSCAQPMFAQGVNLGHL